MRPKIIWQKGSRRIVAERAEHGHIQVYFEESHGTDAMGNEAWLACTTDKDLASFAQDIVIDLAEKNYP